MHLIAELGEQQTAERLVDALRATFTGNVLETLVRELKYPIAEDRQ